jgi:alpha-1,3-mannosyltransferase
MKVLHLCTDFWPATGGTERFVLDLARYSRGIGIEPSVLCLNRIHGQMDRKLDSRDEVNGIPIRRVAFLDFKYYRPAALPLKWMKQADLLHIHGIGFNLDFAAATRWIHRKPIVLSTHGGIFHTHAVSRLKSVYFHTIHRLAERAVTCCAANSPQDYERFEGVGRNLVVIPNGVDLAPLRGNRDRDKKIGRFLFVGRLSVNKHVENLIRAFAELNKRGTDFELHVVGPDREGLGGSLLALAERLGIQGKIAWGGEVSSADLVREYALADCFVSASRYEGFGLSVIEAMAAGCIPILNDIPAFRNLITPQINGFLADFNDPSNAAAMISQALNQDRSAMRMKARARAEEYAWGTIIQRWKGVYFQTPAA